MDTTGTNSLRGTMQIIGAQRAECSLFLSVRAAKHYVSTDG